MLSLIFASIILLNQLVIPNHFVSLADQGIKNVQYPYSFGLKTTARSVLITDSTGEKIIFQKNSQEILPIASLTKLMTVLIFLGLNPNLEEIVEIRPEDAIAEEVQSNSLAPSKINFTVGEKIKLNDLLAVSLIKSANNAVRALVRSTGLGQEEFVKLMNEKAKLSGMNNTFFVEPTGLSPGNRSTAEDLDKLVKIVFDNPLIKQLSISKIYNFKTILPDGQEKKYQVRNINKLLNSFLKIIGAKTGYLDEAGYCFAGLLEYNNKKMIVVTLNSQSEKDRMQEIKGLTWWASGR